MTTGAHSLMGPSSLARRVLCPGSYRMEAGQPDTAGPDADRGRVLHCLIEECIRAEIGTHDVTAARAAVAALESYDANAIDFCMAHFHPVYAGFKNLDGGKVLTEYRVDLTGIAPEIGHGTVDLAFVLPNKFVLVHDFKFGQLPVDPAPRNLQLAAYVLGLAQEFNCPEGKAVLIQPAINHVSEHVYTRAEMGLALTNLRAIVAGCLKPDAPVVPGEKQCRYCRAAAICLPLARRVDALPIKPVDQLTPAEMGYALTLVPLVRRRAEALEARALADLASGKAVPGWCLAPGREIREWAGADETAARVALEKAAAELGKPPGAVIKTTVASPAQIEKAWGKSKKVRNALDPLINHRPGKPKLSPVTAAVIANETPALPLPE